MSNYGKSITCATCRYYDDGECYKNVIVREQWPSRPACKAYRADVPDGWEYDNTSQEWRPKRRGRLRILDWSPKDEEERPGSEE